jgi:hypothetical protein
MGCSQSKPVASTPLEFNPPEPSTNVPPPAVSSVSKQAIGNKPVPPVARNDKATNGQHHAMNNATQPASKKKILQAQSLEQATTASSVSSASSKPMSIKLPAPNAPLRVGSKVNGANTPKVVTTLTPTPPDPRWEEVWGALHPYLLDPADVPAVMSELVSQMINRLSPTEVTFLQRRVRAVVGRLPPREDKSKMMGRVFSSTSAEVESRGIVEKYHLLDEHVFRKVLAGSPLLQLNGATLDRRLADPIAAAYTIMLHLTSESVSSLWDRVADIAVESAKRAGLEMDVNKGRKFERIPAPPPQLNEDDAPSTESQKLGASFSSFSFVVALALRKYKTHQVQKVQLVSSLLVFNQLKLVVSLMLAML